MKKKVSLLRFFILQSFACLLCLSGNLLAQTSITTDYVDDNTQNVTLSVKLAPKDFILKDSIEISIDHPEVKLSDWKTENKTVSRYYASFKDTKKVFDENFEIQLQATGNKPLAEIKNACIYFSYYLGSKKRTIQEVLQLKPEGCLTKTTPPEIGQPTDTKEEVAPIIEHKSTEPERPATFSSRLSHLVATTEALWLRILLVLLLGLLMSLTPCIYPMIPITLGILQTRGSKSVGQNFLQALLYTCGIATTFAVLGLVAAFTGQVFGSIMSNPFFIVAIAILLTYLGLSMFGFYNMYTPRFMRNGAQTNSNKKSLLSIFLFGAASGTVASPCISPGLILLLSIVTALGNKLLGFILLFAFGFGLGTPLLIIGTFSSSLNALPRAGMWMVEVKKIFGFMLFGMVFYFLNMILPWALLLALMTFFMLAAGSFYFYSIATSDSPIMKTIKNTIGVCCCVLAVWLGAKTYQAFFFEKQQVADSFWYTDCNQAMRIAKQEKKRLFIDVGAPFCSICKAIDRTLLQDTKVRAALSKFVNVKVDSASACETTFEGLRKKYGIVGFPTFLLIDSETGDLLARWGSELYEVSTDDFIKALSRY